MNVSDIMTQEVISIDPEATVVEAARIMLEERISGLPVVNASRVLLGIVTEGDLLRRVELGTDQGCRPWLEFFPGSDRAADYVRSHARKVCDVMTRDVAVATEEMPLQDAVQLMEKRRVKRLPVVRGSHVVGVLSRANLVRALAACPPLGTISSSDREIRCELERELAKQPWSPWGGQVIVKDGVVDVWGCISDESHRRAIHIAAENIPGVKSIRDHTVFVEPFSGRALGAGPGTNKVECRQQ